MTIQERPWPRCATPRTFRLWRGRSVCANCKSQWTLELRGTTRTIAYRAGSPTATPFTSSELARMRIYRAAVAHGFYTDQFACAAPGAPSRSVSELEVP
jgi:hypothetical protein